MPIQIEKALRKQATKKGLKGKARDAYIYGTLNKIEVARYHKNKGFTKQKKYAIIQFVRAYSWRKAQ